MLTPRWSAADLPTPRALLPTHGPPFGGADDLDQASGWDDEIVHGLACAAAVGPDHPLRAQSSRPRPVCSRAGGRCPRSPT